MLVAFALCAGASIVVAPATASASSEVTKPTTVSYVALGDSFAAGQGSQVSASDLIASSGVCARYTTAYPELFAAQAPRHISLNSVACSGATAADVATSQLSALRSSTNLITVTVGGNDAGFVPVVLACAQQTYCQTAIQKSEAFIKYLLPAQLTALYRGIKLISPNAHVIVLGYPDLFGSGPCTQVGQYLDLAVRQQLDGLSNQLDLAIAAAAKASRVSYQEVRKAFAGHGVCGIEPWINGVGPDQSALLHPNTAGQQAYAKQFTRAVSKILLGVPPRFSERGPREFSVPLGYRFSRSFAAIGGTHPLSYSIVKGALPAGVTFNLRTGVISGTLRTAGHFAFTWSVSNAFGTVTRDYSGTVK